MLTRALKKVGNSQAIFLDKTLLGLVGAHEETVFKVTVDGNRLVLEPLSAKEFNDEAMTVARRVMKKHAPTLKKLAK